MNGHSIWAEVDLAAIAFNLHQVRRLAGPEPQLMAVVKADGYGHGAFPVARTALENGADWLGVARLDEGIALRQAGIQAPILVFGYVPAAWAGHLLDHDLTATIFSLEQARQLATLAATRRRRLRAHLKIDTGMGRLGLPSEQIDGGQEPVSGLAQVIAISRLPGLAISGIYTHFAAADDPDKQSARRQFARYSAFLAALQSRGLRFPCRHTANSAAIIALPETHLDLVRAGLMLYGLWPSPQLRERGTELRPALQLKARVAQVKMVPAGFPVSYGGTYVTPRATRLATVTVGYGDGYHRLLSSRGEMLVGGQRAPVVGRVCMDQTVLDVGHIDRVEPGDEVVLFGRQGAALLPVEEVAAAAETIQYEIVTALTARVPRHYKGGSGSCHRT
jgi:alanine racemase